MDSAISAISYSDNTLVQSAVTNAEQVVFKSDKQFLANVATNRISTEIDSAAISEHGQKLNSYYKKLEEDNDDSAISGMRFAVRHLASKSNDEPINNFMKLAQELDIKESQTKPDSTQDSYFKRMFSDVTEIRDKNLDAGKWVEAVSNLNNIENADNIEIEKSFMDTAKKIVDQETLDRDLQRETFNKFISITNTLSNDPSRQADIPEFFDSVLNNTNLDEIKSSIDSYAYNMVNRTR